MSAAVVLSAVIKSGTVSVPGDWEDSFAIVIETLRFWEVEFPDLPGTRTGNMARRFIALIHPEQLRC